MELLQRITKSLNDESLPTLQLTYKTLESAKLDQFTETFLSKRCYFVHEESRRVLLKNLLSTRLAGRMREITFTHDSLEGKSWQEVQTVPEEEVGSVKEAQLQAYDYADGPSEQALRNETRPSTVLIHRVLIDIQTFAPSVQITFGIWDNPKREYGDALYADMIVAAATTKLLLKALRFSESRIGVFSKLIDHLEPNFAACVSSLDNFGYNMSNNGRPENKCLTGGEKVASAGAIRKILMYLNNLCEFRIALGLDCTTWDSTPAKLLLGNSFPHLRMICLAKMACDERDLMVALSGCRSTLVLLHFSEIHLTADDGGKPAWVDTLALMSSMQSLRMLTIHEVFAGDQEPPMMLVYGSVT